MKTYFVEYLLHQVDSFNETNKQTKMCMRSKGKNGSLWSRKTQWLLKSPGCSLSTLTGGAEGGESLTWLWDSCLHHLYPWKVVHIRPPCCCHSQLQRGAPLHSCPGLIPPKTELGPKTWMPFIHLGGDPGESIWGLGEMRRANKDSVNTWVAFEDTLDSSLENTL